MSTMQDRTKIAPRTGGNGGSGSISVIACRSTNSPQKKQKNGIEKTTLLQKISAFEDAAAGARKRERSSPPRKKSHDYGDATPAALAEAKRDDRGSGGNNIAYGTGGSSGNGETNNFLHDNDFSFIDADDDLPAIAKPSAEAATEEDRAVSGYCSSGK